MSDSPNDYVVERLKDFAAGLAIIIILMTIFVLAGVVQP